MSKIVFIGEARAALAPVVTSAKEQSEGRLPCALLRTLAGSMHLQKQTARRSPLSLSFEIKPALSTRTNHTTILKRAVPAPKISTNTLHKRTPTRRARAGA